MRNVATQTEREHEFVGSASVIQALDAGVIVVDLAGTVRQINRAAADLFAIDPAAALGQPLDALLAGWRAADEQGEGAMATVAGRPCHYRCRPLLAGGEPIGTLVLLRDLSNDVAEARRQYDYLCRALHDVRVPLQAISGAAEGLIRGWFGPITPEQHEFVAMIKENAGYQAVLFNQLHDAYALSTGTIGLSPAPFDLAGLLLEIEHELAGLYAARTIGLAVEVSRPLPTLHADRQRLRQALLILLDNAQRYTFPGGSVVLRAYQHATQIVIDVQDTGVGIRAADQPQIFTPFFRGESPLKAGRYGGLNLAIAYRLAELHGGQLTFISTEGQGSTFTLTLPIKASA